MDVVILFNGLGNQMSQYAFYLQKKSINKSATFISINSGNNGLELEKVFKINTKQTVIQKMLYCLFRALHLKKIKIITSPIKRLLHTLNFKTVNENFNYNFNKDFLLNSNGITFYYGGWHSEKYFSTVKNRILKSFEFTPPNDPENLECIHQIIKTNSISLHVRRGDYFNSDNYKLFGNVCTQAYFEKAIDLMGKKISNPNFFVFSDDISWVKSNLKIKNATYITYNTKNNSWKDMYLMTLCKHNIISNSSFSWWGAWLNKNPDKIVISPNRFLQDDKTTDFYPESWIKLSDY